MESAIEELGRPATGLSLSGVAPEAALSVIGFTTVGNVIGGAVFVGLLDYGHVALAGERQDVDVSTDDGG